MKEEVLQNEILQHVKEFLTNAPEVIVTNKPARDKNAIFKRSFLQNLLHSIEQFLFRIKSLQLFFRNSIGRIFKIEPKPGKKEKHIVYYHELIQGFLLSKIPASSCDF